MRNLVIGIMLIGIMSGCAGDPDYKTKRTADEFLAMGQGSNTTNLTSAYCNTASAMYLKEILIELKKISPKKEE